MDPLIVMSGNVVIAPGGFLRRKVRAMSRNGNAHGPVLVVGGGGYIGTYVVEQLLAKGRSVRVLDRLMFGQKPLQDFLANPRFELIPGEATDVVKLVEAMQGASAGEHLSVTILRFATVFGHSRRPRFDLVANLFTAQAMVDGKITLMGPSQWRPFVHVRDLARGIVAALEANPERMRGQVFNVGDRGLNMTIGQLAALVQKVVSRERPVEIVEMASKDPRNYAGSFEKIRRELGFEAEMSMQSGIEEIVSEFKKGSYGHYKDAVYSNLETTKKALSEFRQRGQTVPVHPPVAATARARLY